MFDSISPSPSKLAIDWLDRDAGLVTRRNQWLTLWQSLSDMYDPIRGSFTATLQQGQETPSDVYDTTPRQSARALSTAISSMLKSSASRWLWMTADDQDVVEDPEAKLWFDAVGDRMWQAIYAPEARFVQQSGAVDYSTSVYGLGYLWIDETRARNNLSFRALQLANTCIDENSDGQIDTLTNHAFYTARQAEQKLGSAALGPKVREALLSTNKREQDKKFEFVQCVYPRWERDPRRTDTKNMAYANLIISKEDQTIVEESGYPEFPCAVPRWDVAPYEVYARSPAMLALPDCRTLQAMGRTILVAGQKAVDPPLWYSSDGVLSVVRTFPGGATAVSAEAVKDMRGPPLGKIDMAGELNLGREMQDDYRKMVAAAFYKDVFTMPTDGHEMTATEVEARNAQFLRTIAPTLGQLETDYVGVIAYRVFGMMLRRGMFPPIPAVLKEARVHFEFMSPVQRALREMEMAGLGRALATIAPLEQAQPGIFDNFDGDAIAQDVPEAYGLRQTWVRSPDDRDAGREQKSKMAQAAAGLGALQQGAAAGKDISSANLQLAQAQAVQPAAAPSAGA